ncbi:MAG: fluoride efflux transporter CrcB [Chloroherpetonaceae bacterium]|nr:fluoride efflux transporter CrcB [Chloroherpetonaceae bacterium]MDW8438183.1 fluoride efflux transporter CrcB [Chloroherpetonaceae bacterium]
MKTLLGIGVGSFIGGTLRYLVAQWVQTTALSAFPFGTLAVNVIGCFLIGAVFALTEKGFLTIEWRLFLATGLLGGFTTFSAFSNETVAMLRDGQFVYAAVYVGASVALGLLATVAGAALIKLL